MSEFVLDSENLAWDMDGETVVERPAFSKELCQDYPQPLFLDWRNVKALVGETTGIEGFGYYSDGSFFKHPPAHKTGYYPKARPSTRAPLD